MLKWIAEWWRFLLLAMAISAIAAVAKRFLENWIADSIITFITLIGGANMIFDLIGRRSWEQRLAEKDREIANQAQVIATQAREISSQGQEISDLRQRLDELERKFSGQSQTESQE